MSKEARCIVLSDLMYLPARSTPTGAVVTEVHQVRQSLPPEFPSPYSSLVIPGE
jgi:hypothetical protein